MQKKHNTIHPRSTSNGKPAGWLSIFFSRTLIILLLLLMHFFVMFSLMMDLFSRFSLMFGSIGLFTAVHLIHVLNSSANPSVKLSWCFLIAVFPVFGAMLYWFVKLDIGYRMEKKRLQRAVQESAPLLPDGSELMAQVQNEDPSLYHLCAYLQNYGHSPAFTNTQVRYFPLGEEMFRELLFQLENAKEFIFLEYFLIGPGYMWDSILEVLKRKAQDGIEVQLMYDGSSAIGLLPHDYPGQLEAMGIKCKVFFPFLPFLSTHYNNRDHRKIAIIDGHTAFTGGINLQDRYINREEVYGHWKDTAVMVQGDAAQSFTRMFLQMWNYNEKDPVYAPYLHTQPRLFTGEGYVIPYSDSPLGRERIGKMVYLHILNQAKNYVYIMTPYLILDSELLTALTFAAKRGIDVRILLPHIPDKRTAFLLARSHYRVLTDAGVKIYEYTPGFVHAKVFLSDDICATVGTVNLDYRSLYLHFECGAYLHNVPALEQIRQDFHNCFACSQHISLEDIRRQSLISRIAGAILKLFAPLM